MLNDLIPQSVKLWLLDPRTQLFGLLLLLTAGFILLLVQFFNALKRKKKLKDYDISVESYQQDTTPWLSQISLYFSKFFSSKEDDIQDKFIAAGFYESKLAPLYMPIKYGVLLAGGVVIYFLSVEFEWQQTNVIAIGASWLVLVIIAPDSYLAARSKNLQNKISGQLPYLLDLMAVCVQTGMTVEAAMTYLGKEMAGFDKDLSHMLNKTNDRAKLVGLEKALEELYTRVPSNEMRSFVMTLTQSLQYGTSIYQVLTTLASDIRDVQMLQLEEKIGKLAAKMSIPLIVFIMVPIVILIAAPGIMRMMSGV